jgi:uncharacterized protein YcfL
VKALLFTLVVAFGTLVGCASAPTLPADTRCSDAIATVEAVLICSQIDRCVLTAADVERTERAAIVLKDCQP